MGLTRLAVEPSVLRWARTTAGLDIATAADRIGVKSERLDQWEDGSLDPTIGQIRAMADVYARPLAALFMPSPLAGEDARELPDYRRQESRSQVTSRALQRALMRAHRQRDALREVAADLDLSDDETTPSFAFDRQLSATEVGRQIREHMGIESIPRAVLLQPDHLLRVLVARAEALNVTVIQVQRVELSEMRGFSLGDGSSPIVALNGADWPRGKIYTLLHELVHVGLRSNGLCDLHVGQQDSIERLCDRAAAEALMPSRLFLTAVDAAVPEPSMADLARVVGNGFGASGEAALIRMIELGRATWEDYRRAKPDFDAAYSAHKSAERERNASRDSPIYYQVKRRDLGRRFIGQMVAAYDEDVLSSRDLAHLLEVSFDKVPKLAGAVQERG